MCRRDRLHRGVRPIMPGQGQVAFHDLIDLEANGEAGVQAGHWLLKDHRHVFAGDPAALIVRHLCQVFAIQRHPVCRDLRCPGQ